jgi:hypothetical protein
MPRNSFTVTVDDMTALTASLVSLPESLKPGVSAAAFISATNIRADAIARLERQLVPGVGKGFGGHPTGETASGILVNPLRNGWGWIVDAGNVTTPLLDRWLEKGTENMPARTFFYAGAQLEQQAHADRIAAAIQAVTAQGLGDRTTEEAPAVRDSSGTLRTF